MGDDAVMTYLEKHKITPMLNGIVNELVREQPDDPISYIINGLLKEANARGQDPALLQRLVELKQTLLQDQKEAGKVAAEKVRLEEDAEKLKYRVTHLCKTLDELEKGSGKAAPNEAAPAASAAVPSAAGVPLGHTAFSWAGGAVFEVPAASAAASSASSGAVSAPLLQEPFSARVAVAKVRIPCTSNLSYPTPSYPISDNGAVLRPRTGSHGASSPMCFSTLLYPRIAIAM